MEFFKQDKLRTIAKEKVGTERRLSVLLEIVHFLQEQRM